MSRTYRDSRNPRALHDQRVQREFAGLMEQLYRLEGRPMPTSAATTTRRAKRSSRH